MLNRRAALGSPTGVLQQIRPALAQLDYNGVPSSKDKALVQRVAEQNAKRGRAADQPQPDHGRRGARGQAEDRLRQARCGLRQGGLVRLNPTRRCGFTWISIF